jgi:hypothetical protein
MFQRLRQALRDHKAMGLIRSGNGDVNLTFVVVGGGLDSPPTCGYECDLYQGRERHFASDPAEAVIGAIAKLRGGAD